MLAAARTFIITFLATYPCYYSTPSVMDQTYLENILTKEIQHMGVLKYNQQLQ
jgi:hypothetical protein